MSTSVDVAVIGGGIAGASLARALADEGLGVTVLEATTEFPDRVRGESMQASQPARRPRWNTPSRADLSGCVRR